MTSNIAANARRYRQARKMTQALVAERAGISRVGYRNIESGKATPKPDTMFAVARALDVPVGRLVEPAQPLERVRFRSSKRLRTRAHVLAEAGRRLRDFADLEDVLGARLPYRLAELSRGDDPRPVDPVATARKAREALGLDDKEPIHDISGLLESAGIKVIPLPIATEGFFGLSVAPSDGGPAIVVNTWDRISVERWIFTAAHELGHLLLHSQSYDATRVDEDESEEREADRFAAHLLMPERGFKSEWDETAGAALVDRVLKVKRIFRVSYRTVLRRLAELGQEDAYALFMSQFRSATGRGLRRTDEPDRLAVDAFAAEPLRAREPRELDPADFVPDRLGRLVRRAVESGDITLSRAAEVLDISLPRMRERASSWVA